MISTAHRMAHRGYLSQIVVYRERYDLIGLSDTLRQLREGL